MNRTREAITSSTYDVWAGFYDRVFGALVYRRQAMAVAQLRCKPGDRVLDLGVGTGMLLPRYPRDVFVVGLDISPGMLEQAERKCRGAGLAHCRLVLADALHPPFGPGSFDHVVITHVVSVVSDPARLLRQAARLLKPGGRIVVLNHFHSSNPVLAFFEHLLNPLFLWLGWRSDLGLEEALAGTELVLEYQFTPRLVDFWRIVVLAHPVPKAAPALPLPPRPVALAVPELPPSRAALPANAHPVPARP